MTKTSLQKSPNAEEKNTLSEPAFLYHKTHQRNRLHGQVLPLAPFYIKCHETIG